MRKVLIFSCILGLALIGCSNNSPVANEETDVFPYAGSSDDPMAEGMTSVSTHLVAVPASDFNMPAGTQDESYACLWTSGTYAETGVWLWRDLDFKYTVGSDGSLAIETINLLCDGVPGQTATAAAFYFPPTETKALNYDLFGSISWGSLPAPPPGSCWVLMVDWGWSGIPHGHGISVNIDWAGAMGHGTTVPPIADICGWPLNNPAPQVTLNGI